MLVYYLFVFIVVLLDFANGLFVGFIRTSFCGADMRLALILSFFQCLAEIFKGLFLIFSIATNP